MLLGELLIQKKLISKTQLDEALLDQKATRDFLGAILVRLRFLKEHDLMQVLSEQFHIPTMELRHSEIDWNLALRFTPSVVIEHQCLPIRQEESMIIVAIVNPLDAEGLSRAQEQAQGTIIRPVLVSQTEMREALKIYNDHRAARIKKMLE